MRYFLKANRPEIAHKVKFYTGIVRTNVEETNNVILSSIAHGEKNVLVVSTDKTASM